MVVYTMRCTSVYMYTIDKQASQHEEHEEKHEEHKQHQHGKSNGTT